MAILRKNNKERYTVVPEEIIRDNRLSLKEFGLLIKMLSLPDNWKFSEKGLETIFEKDGISAIRSGLQVLEELGYLERERSRNDNGTLSDAVWTLYGYPRLEKPILEKPILENPILDNRTQYNTNLSNTKESKTKESIPYAEIVEFLNEKAGTRYRPNIEKTRGFIHARWQEGFRLEDFKKVIDIKCKDWKNDSHMRFYLRPETLFGTKFEGYLNQKDNRPTVLYQDDEDISNLF